MMTLASTPFAVLPANATGKRALRVTMKDSTVYMITDFELSYRQKPRTGFYTYFDQSDYKRQYVPVYAEPIIYHFPASRISEIVPEPGAKRQNLSGKCKVVLLDHREFLGSLRDAKPGYDHDVLSITGKVKVEGYPAEFSARVSSIAKIIFLKDQKGRVRATVTQTDGTVTKNVSAVEFTIDGEDSRSGTDRVYNDFKLKMKNSTLDIPVKDVTAMDFAGKTWSLHLKNGKTLNGTMRDFYVYGKLKKQGKDTWFYGYVGQYRSEIRTVEFVKDTSGT
jgi:hypothetical protein